MSKPFYEAGGISIWLEDCRDLMARYPDRYFDLVLTDPPYTEQTHVGARTAPKRAKRHEFVSGGNSPGKLVQFDAIRFRELRTIFNEVGRVSARWVISFMDWRHVARLDRRPPAGLRFVRQGIWVKTNGAPQFTGDRPAQGYEAIAILHRADAGRMVWNGGGKSSVYFEAPVYVEAKVSNANQRAGKHATAKPRPLVTRVLRDFANLAEPAPILDPFCGSGVVLHMAAQLGLPAVGCDLSEQYCEDAANWLVEFERAKAAQSTFMSPTPKPRGGRLKVKTDTMIL